MGSALQAAHSQHTTFNQEGNVEVISKQYLFHLTDKDSQSKWPQQSQRITQLDQIPGPLTIHSLQIFFLMSFPIFAPSWTTTIDCFSLKNIWHQGRIGGVVVGRRLLRFSQRCENHLLLISLPNSIMMPLLGCYCQSTLVHRLGSSVPK